MPGSIRELRRMMPPDAYGRVKPQVAKRDWEIVAWDEKMVVLRIERENVKFDRKGGLILERFKLRKQ